MKRRYRLGVKDTKELKEKYTEKENPFLMGKSKGDMDAYWDVIQIIKLLQDGN